MKSECVVRQVGRDRCFTPTEDDCHSTLKVDVVVTDSLARAPYTEIGKTFTSATHRVRSAPQPPRRALVSLPAPKLSNSTGKFSVLTYNLLADLYTNVRSSLLLQTAVHEFWSIGTCTSVPNQTVRGFEVSG